MTQDEIIEMARRAGLHVATDVNWMPIIGLKYAESFAKLVAEREREACAKVCEAQEDNGGEWDIQQQCANAIRARGKHD